ncbi:SRPBCC family protein [Mycolicibacterium brisbanense]|uniref:Carbon monoxide dehydrogenase subunit G n=2 Tax=Mycolicibacterium brisbanense TaxID=146020 RepID=A0A117I792_9MYCO|nr:SRPBCC family protein [Mycolicibacterium brisbanense]GAS91200.1 carbon monoxide dehydrogenase subunit G [Mycolicibacterium brisbanense]
MQLVNEFTVDAPLDVAWAALTDIPRVVGCIPGAELEGHEGEDYRARVAVKVGPVGLTLAGTATVVSRDDTAHQMVVRGAARDRTGNGSAEATVTMSVRDGGGHAQVTVRTDLELGGRIAQFGSGVISQVANRIIGQFVRRLNSLIAPAEQPSAVHQPAQRRTGENDWLTIALMALAGVALGLAVGRTAERLA